MAAPSLVRQSTRRKADTLLREAAALIAERGFGATAIRDVGRRVEVSLGGMYYYFASKDDLLFQIQLRTFESLLESQARVFEAPRSTPVDRLRGLLAGHLGFFARHPNEMKICTFELESLKGERYQRVLSVRRKYFRLMADAVAEVTDGKSRRRNRHLTLFVFGMLNWAFMWYDASRDGPVEAVAREMMDLVLRGVAR